MSNQEELFCEECGADFVNDEECKCHIVAAELDPAREPDAVEVLISAAKKALKAIDAANEEAEGPMAMPVPAAEELREAIYLLEDIWSLIPYDMLTMLRLEMISADFNARAMREDGVEDLPAYAAHLKEEMEKEAEVAAMNLGEDAVFDHINIGPHESGGLTVPRQEDGIEIDPEVFDDDGNIGAANPDMLKRLRAMNKEDLAVRNLKFFMKHGDAVPDSERLGMTLAEVIKEYNPAVIVKCPYTDHCGQEMDEEFSCPHSHEHVVGMECLTPCALYSGYTTCKPMEAADEEAID